MMRMIKVLTQPPAKPASRPRKPPMQVASATGTSPMTNETRPPKINRVTMSRPSSSVPSRCPRKPIGLRAIGVLVALGSNGAITDAKTAASAMTTMTSAKKMVT